MKTRPLPPPRSCWPHVWSRPPTFSGTGLPRSAPEAQGIASSVLLGFVEALESKIDAVHSVMVVRHGHVVAEGYWAPYAKGDPHMLFSLSKSFTSTAVGLAAAEGRLSSRRSGALVLPGRRAGRASAPT